MNIAELSHKIKPRLDVGLADWGLFVVVILVGAGAFGLGRFSALEEVKSPVSVGQAPAAAAPEELYMGGLIVASRTGSVYYYPWCAGAQNMAEDKKRWFVSEEAARAAGYTPSKACKGLGTQ